MRYRTTNWMLLAMATLVPCDPKYFHKLFEHLLSFFYLWGGKH